jgi:CRP-like cAMP-binding protein
VLLRSGERVGAVYFVREGTIACRRKGRLVGQLGPGDGVGGLVLFARDPEGLEATAEVDSRVLELDAEALLDVFEDRFVVFHHVLRGTCRQLVEMAVRSKIVPFQGVHLAEPPVVVSRDLDLVDRIFFLRSTLPFRRSSINALAELSRSTTQVRFDAGTTLWNAGDLSTSTYLIIEGTVHGRIVQNGVEFDAGPGTPLGSSEAMAELPRWYDATATTPVVALLGSSEALLDVLEDNYQMARDYLAMWAKATLEIVETEGIGGLLPL